MDESLSDFAEFVKEQLAGVHTLATTRFFGGTGFTSGGIQFAMMIADSLYFVVDNETCPSYETLGSRCFSYSTKKGLVNVNRYFEVPAQAIEEPEQLVRLAMQSIAIACRPKSATTKHGSPKSKPRV